jgi:hypothetical protein
MAKAEFIEAEGAQEMAAPQVEDAQETPERKPSTRVMRCDCIAV